MAISPNDLFTSGQILTATECNQFPFGIVGYGIQTATQNSIGAETQIAVTNTFTALANRYYRITFVMPRLFKSTTGTLTYRIRKTNTSGTQYQARVITVGDATLTSGTATVVTTLDAGSQVIIGSMQSGTGVVASEPSATAPALIIVEDIGPA